MKIEGMEKVKKKDKERDYKIRDYKSFIYF